MTQTLSPFPHGARVAAYLRDSGGEDQDLSIEQQEIALQSWCAEKGLILSKIFRDVAISGSSTIGRDAFKEMMSYFQNPPVPEAGLIIWKFSRFARNMDDAQLNKAYLRTKGFIVHSLNDAIPDGLDGRFFEAAIDWMNARYLDDLRTDVKRGLYHNVEAYGAIPGTPPVGFIREALDLGTRRDGSPHIVHRWVPDPDRWETCRLAWDMRANGATYPQIHEQTHLFRTKTSYRDFFLNHIYKGELIYGDRVIPDFVPALITPEIWDQVQEISANRTHHATIHSSHGRKSSFRLSGLITCAICGSPMNGTVTTHRQRNPGHESFGYYACTLHSRSFGHDCDARAIPRDTLDEAITTKIFEYLRSDQVIDVLLSDLLDADLKPLNKSGTEEKIKAQHLAAVKRKLGNILNAIELRGLSAALSARLDELEAEKKKLEEETVSPRPVMEKPRNRAELLKLLTEMEAIVRKSPPEEANAFFRYVLESVSVKRIERDICGKINIKRIPLEAKPDVMSGLGAPGVNLLESITFSWPISKHRIPELYQERPFLPALPV